MEETRSVLEILPWTAGPWSVHPRIRSQDPVVEHHLGFPSRQTTMNQIGGRWRRRLFQTSRNQRRGDAPGLQEDPEGLFPQPSHLELSQYVSHVLDLSSQYGGYNSICNVEGLPNISSISGDFMHVAVPRTFKLWWDRLSRWTPGRCPKNPEWFKSQDFIELHFDLPVFPTRVSVLETYHPGYVVRILARSWDEGEDSAVYRWQTLWSGPADTNLPPNVPFMFSPPIQPPGFATNILRLEFSCSLNAYHMELDAAVLYGIPVDIMQPKKSKNQDLAESERLRQKQNTMERRRRDMEEERRANDEEEKLSPFTNNGYFDLLPFEIIEIILSHMTLPELCCLAQCSRTLRDCCYNPTVYKHLDLKPFWPSLCEEDLLALKPRLTHARSLGLSWTGNDGRFSPSVLKNLLGELSEHLLHLELSNCHWITNESLESVTMLCPNLRDLDLSSCDGIPPGEFRHLSSLRRLQRLILYRTRIDTESLLAITFNCTELRHLNLGDCSEVEHPDTVLLSLASNCQQLRSLNMWRSMGLTEDGLAHLTSGCKDIENLDLGWCSNVWTGSGVLGEMLRELPRLRRLVLTANHSVSDTDLESLANHCPLLEQLDLLGTLLVTPRAFFHLLDTCRHMCFLDVSLCFRVSEEMAEQLANRFPQVYIKYTSCH